MVTHSCHFISIFEMINSNLFFLKFNNFIWPNFHHNTKTAAALLLVVNQNEFLWLWANCAIKSLNGWPRFNSCMFSKEWIHCCCCERLLMNLENEIRLKMLAHFIKEKYYKQNREKKLLNNTNFLCDFFRSLFKWLYKNLTLWRIRQNNFTI